MTVPIPPQPRDEITSQAQWSARGAALLFAALAAFQLALACGAPLGDLAWGGAALHPSAALRTASGASAAYLLAAAGVMLVRADDVGRTWPRRLFFWLNVLLAVQMALNTLANLASKSGLERSVMGAASAALTVLCLFALRRRRS